eukprot:4767448-Prymnesium_polylepis.1
MSAELAGSPNKRLSHHRVARGHRYNAQTVPDRPRGRVRKLRRVLTSGRAARVEKVPGGAE